MTKEEAVRIAQGLITDFKCESKTMVEFCNVVIKALEQEPCEDVISRDELLKAIDTWDKFGYTETGCFVREPKNDYVKYIHYDDVIKCIKGMPPVTPQPKTGLWIDDEFGSKCSCCGIHTHLDKFDRPMKFKHCSMCGAKMIEPQDHRKARQRMSDYIMNRESLKRHCEIMCERFKDVPTSGTYGEHRFVLDLLEQTEWIPVSERLPEKNVEVLATTEWDCITIAEMFSNNDWFIHEGATTADIDDIIAWMPLPQPYNAESEE